MTRRAVTIQSPEDREQVAVWARNVEPGTVVEFRKKSRSVEQNAKMHAMLGEVADQVVWYGQKLKVEDWKNMFTASLRKAQVVPGIDPGTVVPLGIHTSTMTVEEMSNMIELIYAFGADPDHPVLFREPHEDNTNSDDSSASEVGGATSLPEPAGDVSTPAGSILIRFARDVLPKAADPSMSGATMAAIEKRWASELAGLPEEDREKARQISRTVRALLNGDTDLPSAAEFYSEMLGCEVHELEGSNHG